MATVQTCTLTGDLSSLVVGVNLQRRLVRARLESNTGDLPIIDSNDAGQIHFGSIPLKLDGTGAFSQDGIIRSDATGINIVSGTLQYQVVVEYDDPATGRRVPPWESGWFPLTGDVDLKTVAGGDIDVPPEWRTAFRTEMEGLRDAATDAAANADSSADLAGSSETAAAESAAAADASKTAAQESEANAADSATTASDAAGTATTKAGEASDSADAASASETAAQGYADQAAGSVSLVAWAPTTSYAAGDVRQAPDGSTIKRTANGTSRASFDATEEAAWTSTLANPTSVDGKALSASNAKVARTRLQGSGNYKAGAARVLQPFWAALARRNTSPVDILGIGTSLWAGTGSTSSSGRIPEQLLTHLRARLPVNGVIGGYGYHVGNGTYGGPSVAGTGTSAVNEGLGNRATKLTQAGDAVTYANQTCTTVTIYGTAKTAGDSITYDIGSGAYTGTITPGATGRFQQTVTVPRGKYHVVLTWAAGTPVIRGINVQDGDETKGIRFWDSSKGGSKVSDWQSAYGGSQDWLTDVGAGGIVDPDLVIVDALANDASQKDAATYGTQLQALVNLLRTKTAAPIVLWMPHRRNPAFTTTVSPWDDYVAQAYAVAAASSYVTVLDMDPLVDITTVGTEWAFDEYHPTSYGYSTLAAATFEFLIPAGRPEVTVEKDSPYTITQPQEQVRGALRVYGKDAATVPFKVVPAPGQTANLFELADATDTAKYVTVDSAGKTIIQSLTARGAPDGSASGGVTIDGNAGQFRSLTFNTTTASGATSTLRWILRCDNSDETGSNAGSNFLFMARDDNGGTLRTVFSIIRSSGLMTFADGVNWAVGSTTGTKIGTASTQKLGFYGATPVVRPSSTPAAATDAATTQALVNDIRSKLITLGLIS